MMHYEFKDTTEKLSDRRKTGRRGRGLFHHHGTSDEEGSLTYSANSSIGSSQGASSADSSFADIRKVIDQHGENSQALANFLKKHVRDERSLAGESLAYSMNSRTANDSLVYSMNSKTLDSLAYSTDQDTHLQSHISGQGSNLRGTKLLGGRGGSQSSDGPDYKSLHPSVLSTSYKNLGGGQGIDEQTMQMFAPAEHTDSLKRRREKKRREKQEKKMLQQQQKMMRSNKAATSQQQPQQHIPMTSTSQPTKIHNHPYPSHNLVSKPAGPMLNLDAIDEVSHGRPNYTKAPVTPPSPYVRQSQNQESPRDKSNYASSANPITPPLLQESRQGTPPSDRLLRPAIPKSPSRQNPSTENEGDYAREDDEVWYAKWWMMCFPDVIKTMTQNMR